MKQTCEICGHYDFDLIFSEMYIRFQSFTFYKWKLDVPKCLISEFIFLNHLHIFLFGVFIIGRLKQVTTNDKEKRVKTSYIMFMILAGEGNDKDVWWKILKQLIEQEEKGNQSVLHYAVASTLLQYSTLLPAWLVNSYKVRRPTFLDLLKLYLH